MWFLQSGNPPKNSCMPCFTQNRNKGKHFLSFCQVSRKKQLETGTSFVFFCDIDILKQKGTGRWWEHLTTVRQIFDFHFISHQASHTTPPPQCHPIQQIRPYVGIVKGSWWLKKTLVFFRALLCGPNHWLLPPRRAAATAKKRWWLNQPSWERNIFCLALKKLHSWIDMSFWSFFSKKLHLRIQCVCFFSLQISAFQCEKNLILYWIRSLLERSDFSRLDSKIPVKKTGGATVWNA